MSYTPFPKEATLDQGLESSETSQVVGKGCPVSFLVITMFCTVCPPCMPGKPRVWRGAGIRHDGIDSDIVRLGNEGLISRFHRVFRCFHGAMMKNMPLVRKLPKPTGLEDEKAIVISRNFGKSHLGA